MSLYNFDQPAAFNRFRVVTGQQAAMCGVTGPSFFCKGCGQNRAVSGRRRAVPGTNKGGFLCATCAPADVVAPPAASAPVARAKVPAKAEKPAKARNTLLTDEQVLECRAAYEFEGVKRITLERRYGVTSDYMRNLLDYTTRSKLIPKRPRQ